MPSPLPQDEVFKSIAELRSGECSRMKAAAERLGRLGASGKPALEALEAALNSLPQMRQNAADSTGGMASIQAAAYIEQDYEAIQRLEDALRAAIDAVRKA